MGKSPVTCRTLEDFYYIDAHTFKKQYKEVLSGYRSWSELPHADEWLVFPENIGSHLAIDETSLSNGELYTIVTNRERHGGEGCLVAVVSGTKSEDVIKALENIPEEKREAVTEITLDLSDSMHKIVRSAFPKAQRVIDRFHIQKLACDAVQEMRIRHRWDAIQEANDEMENARQEGREYVPFRYENGDTKKELLARSRYLLFKSADKWTDRQKMRARILFELYPDLQKAYSLSHSLRMIFARTPSRMLPGSLWPNGTTRSKRLDSIPSTLLRLRSTSTMMKYSTSTITGRLTQQQSLSTPKSSPSEQH